MAVVNATAVTLSVDGGLISHCTSASLTVNIDLRDKTSKDSGGWSESLGGLKSWELSGDAFIDLTPTAKGAADMFDKLIAGAAVACIFSVDSETYSGNAFITSINMDGGVEENATYSISLTGDGDIERA
jgi:predicted secreted protein